MLCVYLCQYSYLSRVVLATLMDIVGHFDKTHEKDWCESCFDRILSSFLVFPSPSKGMEASSKRKESVNILAQFN